MITVTMVMTVEFVPQGFSRFNPQPTLNSAFSTTKKCSMCQTWSFACKFNSTLVTMTHHIDTAVGESGEKPCGECYDVFMQR